MGIQTVKPLEDRLQEMGDSVNTIGGKMTLEFKDSEWELAYYEPGDFEEATQAFTSEELLEVVDNMESWLE